MLDGSGDPSVAIINFGVVTDTSNVAMSVDSVGDDIVTERPCRDKICQGIEAFYFINELPQ
jgi:hypothetical protein